MIRRPSVTLLALTAAALLTVAACGSKTAASPEATATAEATGSAVAPGTTTSEAAPSTSVDTETAGSTGADTSSGTATSSGSGTASALPADCVPASLATKTAGKLTIATSEPAYEPWMVDNDPTNGKGLESAVAYAVADKLGFAKGDVTWIRVGFDEAISPAPKKFDFDINQFTISAKRAESVDFSSGYYDVTQTVITVKGSPIEGKTSLADLKGAKLGAMIGTTSLDAIAATIAPTSEPAVFKDNALAAQALQGGQIDGLVVDLPTAFYMTGAQLTDGLIVGQLPAVGDAGEQLGLVLEKDSAMTSCTTAAVDALRADGTLADLAAEWIADGASAPVLS
ncbi:amino acid ABC transporter substrate-binding protein [Nakamurella silvestris]|nr:amino acid ABC transporter substrate-binding protein [Nakamurella silvestris]